MKRYPERPSGRPVEIDPFQISDTACTAIPFEWIRRHNVVPVKWKNGTLVVASEQPLDALLQKDLERTAGAPVTWMRASKSSVFFSMHVIARRTHQTRAYQKKPLPLRSSLQERITPRETPAERVAKASDLFAKHTPFGQYLVGQGYLTQSQLENELQLAIQSRLPLGEHLVQKKVISAELRDAVLIEIESNYTKIFNDYCRGLSTHTAAKPFKAD